MLYVSMLKYLYGEGIFMTKGMRVWSFIFCVVLFNLASLVSATSYSLNLVAQGPGTVSRNPTNSFYPQGVVVTITATPNFGAYFTGWSGDANSSANPLNINITGDLSITGSFLPFPIYTLNLVTNGQGSISLNPSASSYYSNTIVTATATPAAGWVFAGWSGELTKIANPLPIPVDTNVILTGSFAQLPTFNVEPQGGTNFVGSTVGLSGEVMGTGPLTYEWYFAGSVDLGATNASLIITNAQSANSGQYWLVASSPYGSATSSIVSVLITSSSSSTNIISVCDEAGLRAAVAIGGWITIGCNGTITLTSPIDITNNVILDGANVSATISGGGVTRLFNVGAGGSLSITNVTLADGTESITSSVDGTNADGGAIYNNGGTVNLISCTLSNNSAQALVGGGLARGGAIFNRGGQVYLGSSLTISNYLMGGLYAPGTFSGAYDVGGTCFGGAIYNESGTVTMANGALENNGVSAVGSYYLPYPGGTGMGGAVYNNNGTLVVEDCVVSNNVCAAQSGLANAQCMGGAFFQVSGSLSITNCLIIINSAVGFLANGETASVPLLAVYGGGIASLGGSVSLNHVSTIGNSVQSGGNSYHIPSQPASGGGIYNQANLVAEYCIFSGNIASVASVPSVNEFPINYANGNGGALYNLGNAILDRCCIFSNLVQGSTGVYYENLFGQSGPGNGGNGCGGGIFNGGQCFVTNTTIALNTAVAGGGSPASFAEATGLNGNAFGGGVYNDSGGIFSAWNVTIATNVVIAVGNGQFGLQGSPGQAAGCQVDNNGGSVSLYNSILGYSGSNSNAFGAITDDGYNISSDGSADFESGSSYNLTDPLLGPLANNGGPTLTMALLPNSPAIDSGGSSGAPATDQRGYARPAGAGVDIGAFEYGAVPASTGTWIYLVGSTNKYNLSFVANSGVTYVLETSTDLKTWTSWWTNGPFANPITVKQPVSVTDTNSRYFRLLIR